MATEYMVWNTKERKEAAVGFASSGAATSYMRRGLAKSGETSRGNDPTQQAPAFQVIAYTAP